MTRGNLSEDEVDQPMTATREDVGGASRARMQGRRFFHEASPAAPGRTRRRDDP